MLCDYSCIKLFYGHSHCLVNVKDRFECGLKKEKFTYNININPRTLLSANFLPGLFIWSSMIPLLNTCFLKYTLQT